MTVKLKTPSNGSVSLTPQDTASDVVVTVPSTAGSFVTANSSGNVGIGTSSPGDKLDIVGTSRYLFSVGNAYTLQTSLNAAGSAFADDYKNAAIHVWQTSGTERMRIDSSGNLLVSTTGQVVPSTAKISILTDNAFGGDTITVRNNNSSAGKGWRVGYVNDSNYWHLLNQSGSGVYITDGATSWTSVSDERIKDIIEPITNAAEKVASLRAVIGKYKSDAEGTRRAFLIAQDVQAVLPEAVNVQADEIGTLGLQYTDTIPLLVAAIKEQQAIIKSLQDRIAALENA